MKEEKSKEQRIREKTKELFSMKAVKTDPNGSYTGNCINPHEVPAQDADDL